jgi:hypothetical protein
MRSAARERGGNPQSSFVNCNQARELDFNNLFHIYAKRRSATCTLNDCYNDGTTKRGEKVCACTLFSKNWPSANIVGNYQWQWLWCNDILPLQEHCNCEMKIVLISLLFSHTFFSNKVSKNFLLTFLLPIYLFFGLSITLCHKQFFH